jgi:hypothetical protein
MALLRSRIDSFEIAALAALLVASAAILRATFVHGGYRGDGTFQVDFGRVDLTMPGSRTFSFAAMPAEEFIVGLLVSPGADRATTEYLLKPTVRIVLRGGGRLVLDQRAPIEAWQWELAGPAEKGVGPSFVYRIGNTVDTPIDAHGTVRIDRTGEAADHGWGTYFRPLERNAYQLTLEVLDGDPVAAKFNIKLVMRNL